MPMSGNYAQREDTLRWSPLVESELFANLQAGEEFHLGAIQNALNDEAEAAIAERLGELLKADFSKNPGLRKLTTCATTAGGNAVTRTIEALDGIDSWSDEKAKHALERSGRAFLVPVISKAQKCFSCSKKIKSSELLRPRIGDSPVYSQDWHVACWIAEDLRNTVQEIRSSKGAIEKQARSARAILQANESFMARKNNRPNPFMVRDRMQFDHWLQGLHMEWIKTTKVSSEYHTTYFNYFKEYAEQILEYMLSNQIPSQQVVTRLTKHLDELVAESVVKKMLQIPVKTLRYFGLVDGDSEPIGSVVNYMQDKDESLESDPELAWAEDALCVKTDPEAFFPEKGGSVRDAKRVCAACSVQAKCLDYALNHGELSGIWGGATPDERKEMARTHQSTSEKVVSADFLVRQASPQSGTIFKMNFEQYSDCRKIAEKYRDGFSILLNFQKASDSDRLRAVDFLTGMIFAQNGSIEKVSKDVFLLLTSSTQVVGNVTTQKDIDDPYEYMRSQLLA